MKSVTAQNYSFVFVNSKSRLQYIDTKKGEESMVNKKLAMSALLITMLAVLSVLSCPSAIGSSIHPYVIVVALQEKDAWSPVIARLRYYHPEATVLTLPKDIQKVVMDVERQVRFLMMDGSLKSYLFYAYYFWYVRSIPIPPGYVASGNSQQMNAIIYLDKHKAEIIRLFHDWFEKELGYQPHYIALIGDIKTRRSDWSSALGITTWWDPNLAYPADAWPNSINAQQVPVPYLPFVIDECLAWYGYAVGRITGLTVDDAVALVNRAGTYNEWVAANPAKANRFLTSYTVGAYNYYAQMPTILTNAGFDTTENSYAPEGPLYPTWANVKATLDQGVGFWQLTCHGNFMTGTGGPGTGLITFVYPWSTSDYYDVKIGGETPRMGWSGRIWDFINNDYTEDKTSTTLDDMPALDHTIVHVSACMTGASEMPLQMVGKGAVAVIMGITTQEVCQSDGNAAYYWNALTHVNRETSKQFSLGEAMAYANDNTHVLHYYYAVSGGMTHWNTMYLIGDPALVPYVPHVEGYPQPLDPPGNNPGAYGGGFKQTSEYYVPMALEAPNGTITVTNTGHYLSYHLKQEIPS